jgi:hypothetical protein
MAGTCLTGYNDDVKLKLSQPGFWKFSEISDFLKETPPVEWLLCITKIAYTRDTYQFSPELKAILIRFFTKTSGKQKILKLKPTI